jgi:hypothetical protein
MSPTFYSKLLPAWIPKVQKYSQAISPFCALEICACKISFKLLVKLTPSLQKLRSKFHLAVGERREEFNKRPKMTD